MGLKHIFNPELFQGYKKKNRYFEGWYFKLVTKDQNYSIALIPGVSLNKLDSHLFIQVFLIENKDVPRLKTYYIKYPYQKDFYHPNEFKIQIGNSVFSKEHIWIDIDHGFKLKGEIKLSQMTNIHQSILSPNIMGLFGYLNFMECYHGVISMNHALDGFLTYDNIEIDFSLGKGYLEKDWGVSFPRAYVWLQSNHFKENDVSLMFSYADIPFLGFYFKGLISILTIDKKEYRFATYNFTKVCREEITANQVIYVLKKRKYRLEITATKKESVDLVSPKDGMMNNTIKEGLSGVLEIKLFFKERLLYQGSGTHAGIEIMKK